MTVSTYIDFGNAHAKADLMRQIGALKTLHKVELKESRGKRSLRANAYYHAVVVAMFADFWRDNGTPDVTDEEAHGHLKRKFLTRSAIDPETGEIIEIVGSTAKMDTREFGEYLEKTIAWLAGLGVIVPEPQMFGVKIVKANEGVQA